ncbi:MAG: DUF521 domain-containing protein [Crenarchaeota archaeon]|nr:DUF521 domain-containing protein [Thermoproteota archaeon]
MNLRERIEKLKDSLRRAGYEEFVKIETAHISGISYINIGEPGLEFLEDIAREELRTRTFTTCNPSCMCVEDLRTGTEEAEKQREIIDILKSIGVSTWLTCTPYEYMRIRKERYYAWSESSAVAFINSIFDAYTDKFPGPLTLISALTGEAPKTEILREEERYPRIIVEVDNDRRLGIVEAGILGMMIGSQYRGKLEIPYVKFRKTPFTSIEAIKSFLAAFSTFSNCPLVIMEGLSVNYRKYREKMCIECKLKIDMRDILSNLKDLSVRSSLKDLDDRSLVVIGCPHLSKNGVTRLIDVASSIMLRSHIWVFTCRFNKVTSSERRNIKVIYDTCLFVSSYIEDIKDKFDRIYTISLKQYYYLTKRVRDLEVLILVDKEIEEMLNNVSGSSLLVDV